MISMEDIVLLMNWLFLMVVGKGAWQGWHYRMSVEWDGGGVTLDEVNTTHVTVTGLQSDQLVKLRVAGVTDSGLGPWSAVFTGRTLSSSSPTILWSANQGLLKSDPTGENLTHIFHREHLQVRCFFFFFNTLFQFLI